MSDYVAHVDVTTGKILRLNIRRGTPIGYISFGKNASREAYEKIDHFFIVGSAPSYDPKTQALNGPRYVWNPSLRQVDKVYTVTDIDLSVLKTKALEKLSKDYTNTVLNGFLDEGVTGWRIDCERHNVQDFKFNMDRMEIKGLTTTPLVDFHNNEHTMSYEDFRALVVRLGDYAMELMQRKWAARKVIDSATTIEEVEAVTF